MFHKTNCTNAHVPFLFGKVTRGLKDTIEGGEGLGGGGLRYVLFSVGWSICHNLRKGRKITFPCFYRRTCFFFKINNIALERLDTNKCS